MRLQIGNARIGERYQRATAYISIKTETDKRYMIFMKSSMTTATDETFRSIKKDGDKVLQSVAEEFYSDYYHKKLFLGRVKYKITRGQKILKHHRVNLPLALIGMWVEDDRFKARFYLLGDDYDFDLTDDLTDGQKKFYKYEGLWQLNEGPLSMEEAFGG
jgi:predicted transcriptional regulator